MSIRLIVRADDAAGSVAANTAIVEALMAETVRNVSVMGCGHPEVLRDWANRFFALPKSLQHSIDLGLHVTLNAEWSTPSARFRPCCGAAQVASLVEVDTGFFTPSPADLNRRGWGEEQVEQSLAEVAAQLRCLRNAGLDPVYLDEHMGVGWLPGLRIALIGFADEEGLIAAERLELSRLPLALPTTSPNDGGNGDNDTDALTDAYLTAARSASGASGAFLLVAHPACDGPETRQFFNTDIVPGVVAVERERERQMLTRPDLARRFQENGATLVRYSDVAPMRNENVSLG